MKLFHISDLHIGKKVNGFSMIEDQRYILTEIIQMIEEERPDVLLISGDVYDVKQPSAEAVALLDDFLKKLAKEHADIGMDTCIISGNHDSAERLAYASSIIDMSGIHISPVYDGKVSAFRKSDEYGEVSFYLLPFLRPADVKRYFPDEDINSYDDAIHTVVSDLNVDTSKRNVILSHQFVTGAKRSESEEVIVGGLDNISALNYDDFDYAALGHIHGPQKTGRDTVRYSGTPLKYSFSEEHDKKSVVEVDLLEKGNVSISLHELTPKHDMRVIRGRYDDLMNRENYKDTDTDDYVKIVLTDEEDIPSAIEKLRVVYPNIMQLEYDNKRTRTAQTIEGDAKVDEKSPQQLFEEFYELQNNQSMTDEQKEYVSSLIEKVWGD
ncbi:MAG: exonuclease SbcCD subunit D [Lachnospiraceae bacterium]|nr:exonuclease SbcCD subunit D [Lachnospiraceae bacterium]MDD7326539.1 exonuclease SbcCD subunit D [Lachnospiraceae bacterium]MDY2760295.1 exonuclease SbcCD subunit D [Lachnospiraceae bacterium]